MQSGGGGLNLTLAAVYIDLGQVVYPNCLLGWQLISSLIAANLHYKMHYEVILYYIKMHYKIILFAYFAPKLWTVAMYRCTYNNLIIWIEFPFLIFHSINSLGFHKLREAATGDCAGDRRIPVDREPVSTLRWPGTLDTSRRLNAGDVRWGAAHVTVAQPATGMTRSPVLCHQVPLS